MMPGIQKKTKDRQGLPKVTIRKFQSNQSLGAVINKSPRQKALRRAERQRTLQVIKRKQAISKKLRKAKKKK